MFRLSANPLSTFGGAIQGVFGLVGVLGLALSASTALAYQQLDTIVAVVEEDVVLASELLSRMDSVKKQMAAADVKPPPNDVLINQLMERLIVESIQLQDAARRGVEIDDETLTSAVRTFAGQNNMTIDQFRQALVQDGLSYREFREEIRREMIIGRLQRNMVNRRITISDAEIDAVLDSPYYQQLLSDEFRVGHILLAIDESATDQAISEAQGQALQIVADLRAGADFAQTAITKSAGARALEGGDLGWKRAGALPSLFAEQVVLLKVGETAEPIRSGSGIHIVQLLEQRGAGMQTEQKTLARHVLVRPSEIRTEDEAEALIRKLHERVIAGEDFAEIAKEFSEDPGSALNGGDLGWSTGEQFVEKFREALLSTEVGKISDPFRSRFGWHIMEVQDRKVDDMGDEARRNMVLQLLHKRRFSEELEEWLKEIRDEAFVEVRAGKS